MCATPATGKRKRKWHSFRGTKRQSQNESARLISALNGGTYLEPNKTAVAQFLDRWLDGIRSKVAPRTHERYAEIARKNLAPLLGSIIITKLRPMQISDAYGKALANGRRDGTGGLSPRTVHHMHRVLKQAMAQAVRWQLIVRNPLDAVDPPKVERQRLVTYDVAQTAELLDAMHRTPMFIPTVLAALCRLRRGEIAALRWRRVDFATGHRREHGTDEWRNPLEPKSGKARTVALSATVAEETMMRPWSFPRAFLMWHGPKPWGFGWRVHLTG